MFLFFLGNGAWSIKCRKDVVLSDWKLSCLRRGQRPSPRFLRLTQSRRGQRPSLRFRHLMSR